MMIDKAISTHVIEGPVIPGQQLGRKLGFPTANIDAADHEAENGIYVVRVEGLGRALRGVASLGTRPTLDLTERLLEVHIFDFNEDIYGQHLRVSLLSKLRDEKRFESIEAMAEQVHKDIDAARQYRIS